MTATSRKVLIPIMLWLTWETASTMAYELRTHEQITQKAFLKSKYVRRYLEGIGARETDIFDAASPFQRSRPDQLADFVNTGTPQDWMIEGSIREDDFTTWPSCPSPKNPFSPIDRPLHHFFDVQRGGGGSQTIWALDMVSLLRIGHLGAKDEAQAQLKISSPF
jgi:hypothetical protein